MDSVGNPSLSLASRTKSSGPAGGPVGVDPRGLRFSAALTAVVLATALLTQSGWLLAAQTAVFAGGAFLGLRRSPYGMVFARLVRPRLGPPAQLEDARPPQFAQLVGFGISAAGLVAFVGGATTTALVAVGLAFTAAFLNAVFGLCLGCELYPSVLRLTHRRQTGRSTRPRQHPDITRTDDHHSTTTTEVPA